MVSSKGNVVISAFHQRHLSLFSHELEIHPIIKGTLEPFEHTTHMASNLLNESISYVCKVILSVEYIHKIIFALNPSHF
jgi:hypothetical protein